MREISIAMAANLFCVRTLGLHIGKENPYEGLGPAGSHLTVDFGEFVLISSKRLFALIHSVGTATVAALSQSSWSTELSQCICRVKP
jgi:hypothetical protein